MKSVRKATAYVCAVILLIAMLPGCGIGNVSPVQESYQYTLKDNYYTQPSAVDAWIEKTALTTDTKDGKFYCFTDDEAVADGFVNAQRTLVKYLRSCGVEIGELRFYGTDYGYSFSESGENEVYVSLSDMKTWQQVLVTLQTVWGDYTDYGYVYAMSNAIAGELGWQTDAVPAFDRAATDRFFAENPETINLLYPTFTTELASEETVNNSKTLAVHLFAKIEWKKALGKSVNKQLVDYYELVSAYAQEISVPFERQTCGYAYYGENVGIRIMTAYAELIIDRNYRDDNESVFGDYWNDYASVYQTANTINEEIAAVVAKFGLEEKAGTVRIMWLDSENGKSAKYLLGRDGIYYGSTNTVYLTSIFQYLHEYYHHIEHLTNPGLGRIWQSQAFCEIGASDSKYKQMSVEYLFTQNALGVELFRVYTGRMYQPGREDYFESMDILCHVTDYYKLEYMTGAQAINSFGRYLTECYGEDAVNRFMLFPETIEEETGKTWEQHRAEWEQLIRDKYSDVVIPSELKSEFGLSE